MMMQPDLVNIEHVLAVHLCMMNDVQSFSGLDKTWTSQNTTLIFFTSDWQDMDLYTEEK